MSPHLSGQLTQSTEPSGDMIVFDLRALSTMKLDGPDVNVLSEIGAARVVLFTFRAGQQLKEHETSSQILVQVLRGRIQFTGAGKTVELRAGMLVQLEASARHGLLALTNAVVLVTMVPSPTYHSLEREVFAKHTPMVARAAQPALATRSDPDEAAPH